MSRTQMQMPRQGVWQDPSAGRQYRHPVSLGLISLPTFHLVVVTSGIQEMGVGVGGRRGGCFALSMGQREQEKLRSAGQWFYGVSPRLGVLRFSLFGPQSPIRWNP